MTATAQGLMPQADALQHAIHRGHMRLFAVVAGTHQGQLRRSEAELPRAAALDERQGLQGLQRGARKAQPVRLAGTGLHLAAGIDHGNAAEMQAFPGAAAGEFDQGCEVHAGDCERFA